MKFKFPDGIAESWSADGLPDPPEGFERGDLLAIFLEALELALEELDLEEYRPLEEYFDGTPPYHDLNPVLRTELGIQTLMITIAGGAPLVIIRIIGKNGGWLGEAVFDLMSMAGHFQGVILSFLDGLKSKGKVMNRDDTRIFIVRKTATLLKITLTKLDTRMQLFLAAYFDEVFLEWTKLWWEGQAESQSLEGYETRHYSFTPIEKSIKKKHGGAIEVFWEDQSEQELSNLKKILLARYYPKIFEHWKDMERFQLEAKDWRRYVNAGDMSDVTDDLIEEFENNDDLSGLALEHAARRAKLYNVFNVTPNRREIRAKGIKHSGYSRTQLFNLKKEGNQLIEKGGNDPSSLPGNTGELN